MKNNNLFNHNNHNNNDDNHNGKWCYLVRPVDFALLPEDALPVRILVAAILPRGDVPLGFLVTFFFARARRA